MEGTVLATAEQSQSVVGHLREGQDQMLRIESSIATLERCMVSMGIANEPMEDYNKVDPSAPEPPRDTALASVARDTNMRIRLAANRLSDLVDRINAELT